MIFNIRPNTMEKTQVVYARSQNKKRIIVLNGDLNSLRCRQRNRTTNGSKVNSMSFVSFKEMEDHKFLTELKGLIRFKITNEIKSDKKYREFEINFENYLQDLDKKNENIKFSDLELIFKDLKTLFEKQGFIINWKALEKQSLDETINALAMASPFSIQEKQILLEAKNLDIRKTKISEILSTYTFDQYNNTTLQ